MAKKAKKAKRKSRGHSRMMVIRVSVPWRDAPEMKAYQMIGVRGERLHTLEILSAYYDMPGQPNARVDQ